MMGGFKDDRGAALLLVAGSMVTLLGLAAFGVDLGWLYLNGMRLQRAADAAALAGVVHMPGFLEVASNAAWDVAAANGYADSVERAGDAVVTPEAVPGEPHQLKVTIRRPVKTFFLRVLGFDTINVAKTATAEYVLPLAMGSKDAKFGDGNDPSQNFWAAIQAPFTAKEHGDPFATQCVQSTADDTCTSSNNGVEYRSTGYHYAVEVPTGASDLRVEVYDGSFARRPSVFTETGDTRWYNVGATTTFQFGMVDATPFDRHDNPPASCTTGSASITFAPEMDSPPNLNQWYTLCTISGQLTPGIYPLQVSTSGTGHASNHFGIRATTTGRQPRVFGIGDISIFVNDNRSSATFYLAEVEDVHAGKILELRFFDPGDADGENFMTILDPFASVPTCSWEVASWETGGIEETGGPTACTINATRPAHNFNGDWVTVRVRLPNDYGCNPHPDAGCWWKIRLDYDNGAHDRTTWTARVIGNPIHLVLDG